MAIDYDRLMAYPPKEQEITYTKRDTMLYALGVGLGFDPLDEGQLRYVYEKDLVALPTIAMAIGHPGWWLGDAGLESGKVVHGEKRMEVIAPMPVEGTVVTKSIVTGATDKGAGKGALIHTQRDIWNKKTGAHLSRQINTMFARGQGGFGGHVGPTKPVHAIPDRAPEQRIDIPTLPQQALLYRLSGDYHPLHADPRFAKANGFPRPILHGLANMAIATHAVLRAVCAYDSGKIKAVECRFTSPVFPGDEILTEIWQDGKAVSFRCQVPARKVTTVDHGLVELA